MNEKRPRIKIPTTPVQWAIEVLTIGLLLAMLIYVWQAWPTVPEQIPQRFDFSGKPTEWSGRASVWLLPMLGLGIYAIVSVLQRLPQICNYPVDQSAGEAPRVNAIGMSLLMWMKLQLIALFASLSWRQLEVAAGRVSTIEPWIVPAAVILILATAAFHVMQMRKGS